MGWDKMGTDTPPLPTLPPKIRTQRTPVRLLTLPRRAQSLLDGVRAHEFAHLLHILELGADGGQRRGGQVSGRGRPQEERGDLPQRLEAVVEICDGLDALLEGEYLCRIPSGRHYPRPITSFKESDR